MIIIDSRESALITLLTEKYPNFEYTIETLDVGDIELRNDDNVPLFTIERKTWADLISSICDKRWHEQGHRLHSLPNRFAYILEGREPKAPRIHPNALRGAILNAQIRDDSNFIRTKSLADTAKLCTELAKRFTTKKKGTGLYAPQMQKKRQSKRKRMKQESTIWIRQLMCVPKVSEPIATLLYETYGTRENLKHALTTNIKSVMDLKYNNRRIGVLANELASHI